MLIDRVQAVWRFPEADAAMLEQMSRRGDRFRRYDPDTGEVRFDFGCWNQQRSDGGGLAYKVDSDRLLMNGSPARVFGDLDAVFGGGASRALDVAGCVDRMAAVLGQALGVQLPGHAAWEVQALDITGNVLLPSLSDVNNTLGMLGNLRSGRDKPQPYKGGSVYWNKGSKHRGLIAYAKGPHLRAMMRKRDYFGRVYDDDELRIADRLLRLEVRLKARYLKQTIGKPLYELTPDDIERLWREQFLKKLGEATVSEMNIEDRVNAVAATAGRAKAALTTWYLIKQLGLEKAREMCGHRTTWGRNLRVLRDAGLSDADFCASNIVQFRRPVIEFQLVHSWEEARAAVQQSKAA